MFNKVLFNSTITKLADPKLAPDAAAELIRRNAISPALKTAVQNLDTWKKLLATKQEECKKILATAESKLEKMQETDWVPDMYSVGEVKSAVDMLQLTANALQERDREYSDAFEGDGFRSDGFANVMRKAFSQLTDNHIEQFKAIVQGPRSKIIAEGRTALSIVQRTKEYVKRAEILYKSAQAAQNKAYGKTTNAAGELNTSMSTGSDIVKRVEEAFDKLAKQLKSITENTTKFRKTKDNSFALSMKSLVADRDALLKKSNGELKTLRLELDTAEKVLDGAPEAQGEFKPKLKKLVDKHSELKKEADGYKETVFPTQNKEITSAGIKL